MTRMRFLIAPDKFKGSLNARGVAENIVLGIRDVMPGAEIEIAPVADGGEGTAEVICRARGGEWMTCAAHGPLGNAIEARYVWLRQNASAVVEMSEAAGSRRLTSGVRDVMRANTFGVGEMILDAAKRGAREIIVGLGGSATNDGGLGMARALGFRFFGTEVTDSGCRAGASSADPNVRQPERLSGKDERDQHELGNGPAELTKLVRVVAPDGGALAPGAELKNRRLVQAPLQQQSLPRIIAAADVRNPLLGPSGATRVFGPQKGAAPEQVEILESALTKLAETITRDLGSNFHNRPGAGAAGGLGFGLVSFCGAELCSGFEVVAKAIQLEEKIARADVVITGEGKLDAQTLEGKAPAGVAKLARKVRKRIYAIAGQIDLKASYSELFDQVYELTRPPITRMEAIKLTAELLRERAREITASL